MISAPDLIETFPFPFALDSYRYSTNVEPAGSTVHTPVGRWGERVGLGRCRTGGVVKRVRACPSCWWLRGGLLRLLFVLLLVGMEAVWLLLCHGREQDDWH